MKIDASNPQYHIRDQSMNEQHQLIFGAINLLYDAMIDRDPPEIIKALFEQLAEFVDAHFTSEEALMAESRFPKLNEHRSEHAYFLARVRILQHNFQTGRKHTQISQTIESLCEWISDHVLTHDKDFDRWTAESQLTSRNQKVT